MEIKELLELLDYAEKMSKGIDPTTNIAFCEDTVLNNREIKRYNLKVANILKDLIRFNRNVQAPNGKMIFNLSQDEKESFDYSDESISISALVYQLNRYCKPYMRKLRATDITRWLQKNEYLETKETESGMLYKVATSKGNELGIFNYKKKNKHGNEYSVNLYNSLAQKYIVSNIETIVQNL